MHQNFPSGRPYRVVQLKAGAFVLAGALWLTTDVCANQTNQSPAEARIPKSTFVSEGPVGRNPFFPASRRLKSKPVEDPGKPVAVVQDFSQLLVLKGITGPPENRIALINNQTFTKGEEGEVKAGNSKVKIRVVEIRDKSVIVEIGGAPKELLLQESLLPITK
jgi:hypothetical protein